MKKALSSLHHLVGLNLPDTVAVPAALDFMHALVPSDTNHFTWVDADNRESNYYGEGGRDEAALEAFFQESERLHGPGSPSFSFAVSHLESIHWSANDASYAASPIYQAVMRPLGGEQLFCFAVRDTRGRPRGMLAMMRDSVLTPFSEEEKRLALFAGRCIGSLFEDADRGEGAAGDQGWRVVAEATAILDADGRLTHCDARARHLLRLASHPYVNRDHLPARGDQGLAWRIRELCASVMRPVFHMQLPLARMKIDNPWGRFHFRPSLLTAGGGRGMPALVALQVSQLLPRELAFWRALQQLPLTDKQRRVGLGFALGRSLSEIAEQMAISRHTVIDHLDKVYERLNIAPGRDALQEYLNVLVTELAATPGVRG